MNKKQQGILGEAAAIFYYTRQGYTVNMPLGEASRYDLIIEKDMQFKRVQVKTTGYKNAYGVYCTVLSTQGGNQSWNREKKKISKADCDLVFIYRMDNVSYEFPIAVLDDKSGINLGKKADKYRVDNQAYGGVT